MCSVAPLIMDAVIQPVLWVQFPNSGCLLFWYVDVVIVILFSIYRSSEGRAGLHD